MDEAEVKKLFNRFTNFYVNLEKPEEFFQNNLEFLTNLTIMKIII